MVRRGEELYPLAFRTAVGGHVMRIHACHLATLEFQDRTVFKDFLPLQLDGEVAWAALGTVVSLLSFIYHSSRGRKKGQNTENKS